MRILMINVVCGIRSTGRICTDLATELEKQGHEVRIAYGRENVPEQFQKYAVRIGNDLDVKIHGLKARVFDGAGFGSKRATRKFIEWVKEYDPDVIHLHNIHGYYINVKILFNYLRKSNKKIIWSFYDCWPFTGHCAHFDLNNCDKWKQGCNKCEYIKDYPKSYITQSTFNYKRKKALFTGLSKMSIIVPSMWMKSIVEQSFMCEYNVQVMPNGIDTTIFRKIESDFRKNNRITQEQCMILGVSSFWTKEKGIEYFIELEKKLSSDKYRIVVVGNLMPETKLTKNIIHIKSTDSIHKLCEIYSVADVFVNPTLQETQGLTTLESLACGTTVIVFNTGGAPECVNDMCGQVIEKGNVDALIDAIEKISSKQKVFKTEECRRVSEQYEVKELYKPIIDLY